MGWLAVIVTLVGVACFRCGSSFTIVVFGSTINSKDKIPFAKPYVIRKTSY
jgi:hypothetical protein